MRTKGSAVAPDGLVARVVIDHDVGLADGSRSAEIHGIGTEVRVCEQGLAIPGGSILCGDK